MYINVYRDSPEVCGMSSSLTRLHLVPQRHTWYTDIYCNIWSNLICLPFPLTILSVSYAHYTLCSNCSKSVQTLPLRSGPTRITACLKHWGPTLSHLPLPCHDFWFATPRTFWERLGSELIHAQWCPFGRMSLLEKKVNFCIAFYDYFFLPTQLPAAWFCEAAPQSIENIK